jgi:hypothetical protein
LLRRNEHLKGSNVFIESKVGSEVGFGKRLCIYSNHIQATHCNKVCNTTSTSLINVTRGQLQYCLYPHQTRMSDLLSPNCWIILTYIPSLSLKGHDRQKVILWPKNMCCYYCLLSDCGEFVIAAAQTYPNINSPRVITRTCIKILLYMHVLPDKNMV